MQRVRSLGGHEVDASEMTRCCLVLIDRAKEMRSESYLNRDYQKNRKETTQRLVEDQGKRKSMRDRKHRVLSSELTEKARKVERWFKHIR